jgi:hypothetical protein
MLIVVKELIGKYYKMKDGERIRDFHDEIVLENNALKLVLKYRVLKHIVEQRKRDAYHERELIELFSVLYQLVENKKYRIIKNRKEENSFLFVESINDKKKGVVVVLEIIQQDSAHYYIKTGFYRASSKIKKLLV